MTGVGSVENPLVNERTGRVIDGHARIEDALASNAPQIWVDYCDITEEQERLALATHDPLSALAVTDSAKLDALLKRAGQLASGSLDRVINAELSGATVEEGKTVEEAHEIFVSNPNRQIIVHYGISDWEIISRRLDELMTECDHPDRESVIRALILNPQA